MQSDGLDSPWIGIEIREDTRVHRHTHETTRPQSFGLAVSVATHEPIFFEAVNPTLHSALSPPTTGEIGWGWND